MKNFVFAILFFLSLFATAQDRAPLQEYRTTANGRLMLCKMTLANDLLKAQVASRSSEGPNFRKCIEEGKSETKTLFESALKTIKKPKAKDALKSYHVAFITSLNGVSPGVDERKINYERRQQELEGKLTEAWARFEVEQ